MKQLPDILTSATFWASIATLGAASGAWFTYVAAEAASRQRTYEGILSLIEGLEAELALVSNWAAGGEGNQGYVSKTWPQLIKENPDWFYPRRAVFKFSTPTLSNLSNSPYVKFVKPIIQPFIMLNHSIRRIFDYLDRLHSFIFGDVEKYRSVLPKLTLNPPNPASTLPYPSEIGLTLEELSYVNQIFMMNAEIHQGLIGGADSSDGLCLYRAFRAAQQALQKFKSELKREPLPQEFWILHIVAGSLAWIGFWEVMRWFEIW
jgi:hypothetical protein